MAEVGHLLYREAGAEVESMFLALLAAGGFTPVDLTTDDYGRMAELVRPTPTSHLARLTQA